MNRLIRILGGSHLTQTVVGMVCLQLFSLVAAVLLARGLTLEEMGRFHLLMSTVTVCTTFAKIGLDEALAYLIPGLKRDHPGGVKGFVAYSIAVALGLSVLIGLLAFFLAGPVAQWVFHLPSFAIDLKWLLVMLPAMVVMLMSTAVLRGLGRSDLRAIVYYHATGLSFPLVLALLMQGGLTAHEAYGARLISLLVGGLVGFALMRRLVIGTFSLPSQAQRESLHQAGGVLIVASLFQYMVEQPLVDLTVMNWIGLTGEIGQYAVAARLASVLAIIPTALTIVAGPAFSASAAERTPAEEWREFQQTSARAAVITITGCLGLIFLGRTILRIFGAQYESGYPVLMTLAIGYAVAAAFNSGSPMLIARGQRVADCLINIICAVAMAALAVLLGKVYGAVGVAAGTALAVSMLNVSKRIVCRSRLGCPIGTKEIRILVTALVASGVGLVVVGFGEMHHAVIGLGAALSSMAVFTWSNLAALRLPGAIALEQNRSPDP